MVDYDSMFDRLLMLQQGVVPKVYDEPSGASLVKALAILGMLRTGLGIDVLLDLDRVKATSYLINLGCTGI